MFGIGIGLPYSVFLSVASSWFPKHRSMIVGFIAAGYGLGALVFTPIQTALINPNNNPDFNAPDVSDRIPNALLVLGGIVLGMQIIGIIITREYKPESVEISLDFTDSISNITYAEESLEDYLSYDSYFEKTTKTVNPKPVASYTVFEALKCLDFYFLWLVMLFGVVPVTLQTSTFKAYGKEYISDDQYLSAIATTSSAFNCFGRIIWGVIADRFSFKCPMNILYICWASMLATFPFICQSLAFKSLYPVWVFVLFFLLAGHFVLAPAAAGRIFGPRYLSTIYGLIFFANAPGTLILSGVISQFQINGKWADVYLSCMGACLLSLTFSLFMKDENGTCMKPTQFLSGMFDSCRHPPASADGEDSVFSEQSSTIQEVIIN
nr:oxalate:formate antiporter [Hymenolepis microstoma]